MKPDMSDKKIFTALKRLYGHFTQRRKYQFCLVLVLLLIGALAELATIGVVLPFLALLADPSGALNHPFVTLLLTNFGWHTKEQLLVPITLLFGSTAIITGVIRIILTYASQKFVFRLGHDLGVAAYSRILHQPYSFHISRNTSETISCIDKVNSVLFSILSPVMQLVIGIIICLSIIAVFMILNPFIAFATAAILGFIYIAVSFGTRRRLKNNSKIIAESLTQRVKIIQEGLGGIRDVLIDHSQSVYVEKFKNIDLTFRDAQTINAFIGATPRFIVEAAGMALIALMALFLSMQQGDMTSAIPMLGALALGAQRILPLLQQIYYGWASLMGNKQIMFDVLELLDRPAPEERLSIRQASDFEFKRSITLRNIGFRYSPLQQFVLKHIDLEIDNGQRVGFVGKTGSGKSTLLDMIMGLLEPTEGQILVDGKELDEGTRRGWQSRIAHVPQAIFLADASIKANIAFGITEECIDMDRVRKAARRAHLSDFIESLEVGYETSVGERGVKLSGGQRQRIGIARALYREADVLIFDEATSALDNETEAAVMEAINELGRDLTILMIAHRLSTVAACDKIVRMDGGHIVEEGSPNSIIKSFALPMQSHSI
jgi:ATP-binding cassette, subfamily B, bacterial PglK